MLAKFRSALSKLRVRQRETTHRHTLRRTLRCESLEDRLLMTGDSWVVPSGMHGADWPRVDADTTGNVYVSGTVNTGTEVEKNVVLSSYASDGQTRWERILTSSATLVVKDMAAAHGGIYIAGNFTGTVDFDPLPTSAATLQSQAELT